MVGLIFALLRSQWRQVLTVFWLALLAVAAAIAAPVYADMAGRSIAAGDIAAAPSNQRTITAAEAVLIRADPDDPVAVSLVEQGRRRDFEHVAPPLLVTPGFGTVFAAGVPAFVTHPGDVPGEKNGDLEFREGFCDRVIVVAGRCVAAPGEAIVSQGRGFAPNATVSVTAATFIISRAPGIPGRWVPIGEPCPLAVVGVYRPRDPTDVFWGRSTAAMAVPGTEPVLAERGSVRSCDHPVEFQEVVAYPLPGTLAVDRVEKVRDDVVSTVDRTRGQVDARTDIGGLLSTIESDGQAVALIPTTAAVPLLALCWFVLFLAIAYTAQARRRELGIVKLRGVSNVDQWTLSAAESLAPVLAGSAAGYLVGHVAVWTYGRWAFGPDVSVPLTIRPWAYAAVAVAGAVLAAAAALRRDLGSTATELLRRVPTRGVRWGDLTLAGVLAVGAAVALVQLRSQPSPLAGEAAAAGPGVLALLAPALALLALGLFCGALLDPMAARVGARGVHKGRLGLAMATLHIGRRHTASRLLAVVAIAIGLLTFAAAAAEVAKDARTAQIGTAIGAPRVLTVAQVRPAELLHAVRAVDPEGAYAMAVVRVDPGVSGRLLLAVDATRLDRVAIWPAANGDLSPSDAAAALRPATPDPVLVRGSRLVVNAVVATARVRDPVSSFHLLATVTPVDGSPAAVSDLGELRAGATSYAADVSCAMGCRLTALSVAPNGPADGEIDVTLTGVRDDGAEVVSAGALGAWRVRNPGLLQARPTGQGLQLTAASNAFLTRSVVPPDAVVPLPVLDPSSATPSTLDLASGDHILAERAGVVRAIPRLGTGGALVDLEYLGRLGELTLPSRAGEIWLGPDAPADAAQRFRAAGLSIAGERRMDAEVAVAGRRPSAAGARFLLVVAVLGLLLGVAGLVVAAGVERSGRADELRALRAQGLSRRQVRRAAVLGYAGLVAIASLSGGAFAAVVWFLTGDRLPLVDAGGPAVDIPPVPGLGALGIGAAGSAALLVLGLVLAIALTRTVERPAPSDRSAR